MSAVSALVASFNAANVFFETLIKTVGIRPVHFRSMFPNIVTPDYIEQLISDGKFPSLEGLAPAITFFIILSAIRFVLQNYLVKPIAARLMKLKLHDFHTDTALEKVLPWTPKKTYSISEITEAAKLVPDRSADEVSRYLWERKRAKLDQQKIVKFVEAFWRAVFYTGFSVVGYYALFVPQTAIWFWDTEHHFAEWPHHELTAAIKFYYQIELGCYFHQLLWTEVSRSDAAEMLTHHIVTILLIIISYITGFFRIGASILFLHDLADIFLESAKVFNYISKPSSQRWLKAWVVDPLFAIFAITFFVTRLVIYPLNILRSLFADGYALFLCDWGGCPTYVGLLFSLEFLHIFWFYLIARMIFKLLQGTMKDDERSEDEEELESAPLAVAQHDDVSTKKKKKNKKKSN